jgi:hypothetical protein
MTIEFSRFELASTSAASGLAEAAAHASAYSRAARAAPTGRSGSMRVQVARRVQFNIEIIHGIAKSNMNVDLERQKSETGCHCRPLLSCHTCRVTAASQAAWVSRFLNLP